MNGELIYTSPRMFVVDRYGSGHSQLLLVSHKRLPTDPFEQILFKGVERMHLPRGFKGLAITDATFNAADRTEIGISVDSDFGGNTLFRLASPDFVGFVVALVSFSQEDDGDFLSTSLFDGWGGHPTSRRRFSYPKGRTGHPARDNLLVIRTAFDRWRSDGSTQPTLADFNILRSRLATELAFSRRLVEASPERSHLATAVENVKSFIAEVEAWLETVQPPLR